MGSSGDGEPHTKGKQIADLHSRLDSLREATRRAFVNHTMARTKEGQTDATQVNAAIDDYEATARELLSLQPDDRRARAALEDAAKVRGFLKRS